MSRSARTKARSWSAAAIASTRATISTAGSWSRPYSPTSIRRCGLRRRKFLGRSCSIIPCDDLEDAIEIANGIEYGLSSALYTKDVNKAFCGDSRSVCRHHLHQRADDRRGSASALRRHEGHRQWPSRGRHWRDRFLHRVEIGLRRLFGQTAEGADRPGRLKISRAEDSECGGLPSDRASSAVSFERPILGVGTLVILPVQHQQPTVSPVGLSSRSQLSLCESSDDELFLWQLPQLERRRRQAFACLHDIAALPGTGLSSACYSSERPSR